MSVLSYLAAGAIEGLPLPDKILGFQMFILHPLLASYLNPLSGLLRVFVLVIIEYVLLVLLAVHAVVHSLAGDAVGPLAHCTLEDVYVVFNHRPSSAVRSL